MQRFDGQAWETLGFVEGAGSTRAVQGYRVVDPTPADGWNYYRLEQVDFDDSRALSPVEAVFFELGLQLSIYPNPTTDQLYIRRVALLGQLQAMSWQLFSAKGQLLDQQTANTNALITLDLQQLLPGSYVLKLSQNGHSTSHVIIKQ